jgi:hypothetical protein
MGWWLSLGLALACWGPGPASAHLIDEVADSIVVDLASEDRRVFELTYVVHSGSIEAFYRQAREAGLSDARGHNDFARRLALAFRFQGCTAQPISGADVRVELPQKGFVAWRLTLRCDGPRESLQLRRVDFDRRKTRTTLYVSIRLEGQAGRRLLVPPRLGEMTLPLLAGAAAPQVKPTPTRRRRGKGPAGAFAETPAPGGPGRLPTDPIDLSRLPPVGGQAVPIWRRALQPPPLPILLAWASEGAHHLVGGLDHLLFLAAIALAALLWRGLLLAVIAFSLGHMCSMALTLMLDWPASAAVEVAIALSICWSGWRVRERRGDRWTVFGAAAFGLVHGVGFGAGLKALVGGSEGILWPIVSFGLGLDLAQSAWAVGLMALWTPVRRALDASEVPHWARRLQHGASWLLVVAGLALAVLAAMA